MSGSSRSTQSLIHELVRETGAATPAEAIRIKARELLETLVASFGEPTMPIDVDVLASLRGIARSDEAPFHSEDAELSPDDTGGVTMRVNADRPETRQRFSVAHEISHTFFPDYTTKQWCRTDARYRDRNNPNEHIEMLCDIGAAELLFPQPWFGRDAASVAGAADLIRLAFTYRGSRDATIRRYVETSTEPIAAAFFVWKLKPTQQSTVGNRDQQNLFGATPEEQIRDALRLRVEYTIASESFRDDGYFLPKDKSVPNEGTIYGAASTGTPADGEDFLDLGQAAGTYRIWAVPVWTADNQLGSQGENAVAAVLRPVSVRKPRKKIRNDGPSLFNGP